MPRLSFSGFDRADEAAARAAFESLALPGWTLSDEADADAVLIDLDSMYGQMAWMKGVGAAQVSIGLTRALRADTTYRLDAPLSAEALGAVLREIGAGSERPADLPKPTPATPAAAAAAPERSKPTTPPPSSEPTPVPTTSTTPPRITREALVASASVLASRLAARIGRAQGPFAVTAEGLPRVVVDPQGQRFAPGGSLKALLGYATAELPAEAVEALDASTAEAAMQKAGEAQPLARLVWLLALGGGEGRLVGYAPGTRFQLGRWPQVEREFPKHFRIATVMLKAPATVAEVALASGASEAEVADYVNAALAVGHAHVA